MTEVMTASIRLGLFGFVRQTQTGTLLTNKQTKYKKTIARCSVLQTLESTKRNFLIRSIVYVYLDLDKHFLQI